MRSTRLLYFVGDEPAVNARVDIADLFGKRLTAMGLQVDWYIRGAAPGGAATHGKHLGGDAWVCGRSRLPSTLGRVIDKLKEMLAALHFFARACTVRYDIIQVRDDFLAGALGLLAARLRGRRFVFWLSFPFPESRLADVRAGRANSATYSWLAGHLGALLLYRLILPAADHTFVQSEQMKQDLLRPGNDPDRLTPVPMGIPDEDMPTEVSPPPEAPIVLYLGSLARARRLDMIIRAFALVHTAVPDARLVIVGVGDVPDDRIALEEEVRRCGVVEAVQFTGQLPRSQALAWIERAAVCLSPIYPSAVYRVSSPTKLIEYMAFGRPVVANDQPPEQDAVMRASGAGLCAPWDEAAFADAIVELLSDRAKRAQAGVNGYRWVAGHRLYSRIAADVKSRYDELLQADGKRLRRA